MATILSCVISTDAKDSGNKEEDFAHTQTAWQNLTENAYRNHNNSSPHLESNTDLRHHIQKRYTYATDNDVSVHKQLKHKLNCLGKKHYQAQALNFQLSF
ncbi:hypothetical protein OUZ56_016636 [Daphnia magna]|uniref:Uncharacterized protein n=1 Tax=Daphnia magna TaxID=35525 RepID=A0ABR0AR55_9CRUS|nr:hypothetical protein OUZ56_016636 [Daphnia magna]